MFRAGSSDEQCAVHVFQAWSGWHTGTAWIGYKHPTNGGFHADPGHVGTCGSGLTTQTAKSCLDYTEMQDSTELTAGTRNLYLHG